MYEELGKRIKQGRKDKNLGLRETAKLVGISATFLSQVENGKEMSGPGEKTIRKLSKVLDIPFDELMHLARRIPYSMMEYLRDDPDSIRFLRIVKTGGLEIKELIEFIQKKD